MSSTTRTSQRGGRNTKTEPSITNKIQKPELKIEPPKALEKAQPTAEQMRIAEITDPKLDDPAIRDKIRTVMEMTQKTEDEAATALFDCDNDTNQAVNYILEGNQELKWSTSKKKKNRTTSTTKADGAVNNHGSGGEGDDWDSPQGEEVVQTVTRGRGGLGRDSDRDRPRQRGSGGPRLRGRGGQNDNRGWRGRENKENERNLEDGNYGERNSGSRRGDRMGRMSNGPGRSGRGGRGGGRLGPRTFQNRDKPGQNFPRSIDTWNNPSTEENSGEKLENWDDNSKEDWNTEPKRPTNAESWGDSFPSPEDWDNEEYTGSLADSKVFTPSTGPEPSPTPASAVPTIPNKEEEIIQSSMTLPKLNHDLQQQRSSQISASPVSGALTAAQTQYFNQLTQSSESYKSAVGLGATTTYAVPTQQINTTQQTVYPATPSPSNAYTDTVTGAYTTANYGVPVNSYNSSLQDINSAPQALPSRSKTQRPRVPPPSKIPSSAVEMPPGDAVSSGIGFLDVQFGGVEFAPAEPSNIESGTSESITQTQAVQSSNSTSSAPVVVPTSIPTTVSPAVASVMEAYSNTAQQTSITSAPTQTQKITSGESMLQSDTTGGSGYGGSQTSARSASTATSNALTDLTNSTSKTSTTADVSLGYNTESYQAPSYQKTQATPSYQTPVSTYNSSNYSTSQVTSSNSGYNSSQASGYTPNSGTYGATSSTGAQSTQSYPNTNSYGAVQQTTSYTYQAYPNASSYQSGAQAYAQQSAYGAGASTGYSYQNSYAPSAPPQQNHKMTAALTVKDSQYDSGSVSSSNISAVTTVSGTPSLGLSNSQTTVSTKVTPNPTASKSGIVTNMPPGVPPILGTQYIMGQGGLPYFHQAQPMFSYEDLQMIQQQRIAPHMATGYYTDMSFQQAPTSLATGRESALANVAYTMSDGRFARGDNNASPVPSTLSQQSATQGQHQTMINPTALPPGYTYAFYGGSMIPAGPQFQYGTQLYQVPPTAAASGHGNSTSGQYKGPGGYGSAGAYGSGYDAGAADYSKVSGGAGYTASAAQTKAAAGTPAGANPSSINAELTAASMYGKSHPTLSKVNSYDKQGFHSGTPPPFNIPGSQNTGLAPSGGFPTQLYIPTLPPHQHHSTALMHQPLHQDGGSNPGPRSQGSVQPNKSGAKQNYTTSFWTAN